MPDARLQRARATLPDGYQFGDALSLIVHRAYEAAAGGTTKIDPRSVIIWPNLEAFTQSLDDID